MLFNAICERVAQILCMFVVITDRVMANVTRQYVVSSKRGLSEKELVELLNSNDSDLDESFDFISDDDELELLQEGDDEPELSEDDVPLAQLFPGAKLQHSASTSTLEVCWKRSDEFREISNVSHEYYTGEVQDPMHYFSKYIDEDTFIQMALCSNMRSVQTTGKSLNTDKQEIQTFWGMSIVMCLLGFPRTRMFWQQQTRYSLVADKMPRDRFFKLRSSLKVVDDNSVPEEQKENKFWKVQPLLTKIREACLTTTRPAFVSLDEQMIPFHGHVAMKQYIRGKPSPWGLKNFVMTTVEGIPLDFIMYAGKNSNFTTSIETPPKMDVGGRVVLKLAESLNRNSSIIMDRYFTSIPLLRILQNQGINGTGTLMKCRIPRSINFRADGAMKKCGRGSHDQFITSDKKIAIVKWYDNKPIFLASTECGFNPPNQCRRWSKSDKEYIHIQRPGVIKHYNENMGGVDLLDRAIAKYRMKVRTRKWTIRCIHHFMDFALAASWLEYRKVARQNGVQRRHILNYYDFRFKIAISLLNPSLNSDTEMSSSDSESSESEQQQPPRKKRRVPRPLPAKTVLHEGSHVPENMSNIVKSRSRCRLQGCKQFTFVKCMKCQIYLCCNNKRNCFKQCHNK